MSLRRSHIEVFVAQHSDVMLVQVDGAQGSVPREAGAFMLVATTGMIGTIGGGQLEFIAIDSARAMLRNSTETKNLDVPLGPEIGQCCGGRVQVKLERLDATGAAQLSRAADNYWAQAPHVYVFGAGHVGRALAVGLAHLPYNTSLIDTRSDVFEELPAEVDTQTAALPEAVVRAAKPGSAFVVLTHDHALDFMIMGEVLKRGDARYAGMIGSKSKRVQFERWFGGEEGTSAQIDNLTCPIGAQALGDKRPQIIAALVIAEIIGKFDNGGWAEPLKNASLGLKMGAVNGA